jgi:hypothetical protein
MLNTLQCPTCKGLGEVSNDPYDPTVTRTCETCKGSGRVPGIVDPKEPNFNHEYILLWVNHKGFITILSTSDNPTLRADIANIGNVIQGWHDIKGLPESAGLHICKLERIYVYDNSDCFWWQVTECKPVWMEVEESR